MLQARRPSVCSLDDEGPGFASFVEADDGTRTRDLLDGNCERRLRLFAAVPSNRSFSAFPVG
jgi:hypothetical protein